MRTTSSLLLTTLLTAAAHAASVTAVTVEEQTLEGQLLSLDATPAVTVRIGGKPRRIPCADLLELRFRAEPPKLRPSDATVVLRSGGALRGALRGGGGRAVALRSPVFGAIECPLGAVARILLPAATPPRAIEPAKNLDRLLLLNGELVEGTVESLDEGKVAFRSAHLGLLEVTVDRITAIAFATESAAPAPPPQGVLAIAHTDDGSVVHGRLGPLGGAKLALHTFFGAKLSLDVGKLLRIEFRGGRLTYLSDLDPVAVKETPFFDVVWHYRRDRSVDGAPLRIAKQTYRKGLGTHARCELTYALDGGYRRFMADVGIDEEVGGRGNVDVRILVDGEARFERTAITGRHAPIQVDLDLTKVKRLSLVVDFGAQLDICDHLDWANARLIR